MIEILDQNGWHVDENPTDNVGFEFASQPPMLKVAFSPYDWNNMEYLGNDPDIEMVLFESYDDALALLNLSLKEVDVSDLVNVDGGSFYGIYKTSKGYLLTWHDSMLEFGGNLLHPNEPNTERARLLIISLSEYSECHFEQNAPYLVGRCDHLPTEYHDLWRSIFTEIGVDLSIP